jgi:hypothetical protein
MSKTGPIASTFAHLAGLGRGGLRADDAPADDKKPDAKAEDPPAEDDETKPAAKADDDSDSDDDDKTEMNGKGAASAARGRERARCAAIFASPHAAANVALAASLAFETTLTRKEALAVLQTQPVRAAPGAGREARNPSLGPGGAAAQTGHQAIASSWDRAFKSVGATPRA